VKEMNDWQVEKLGEVISFNPSESINKGSIAKKVAMEKLHTYCKYINDYEETSFAGGSKFRNGDTLLARITPCLENGKTAQVTILNKDEVGFGSTEFIVMREKEDITDKDFIYYLSISPSFRDIAIKSMTGTTGRQRVQISILLNHSINLPPLPEQKAIAAILSCLDDMIELNNRTNKILEEMAQAIFKRWFVDFEFPNEDGKPYKSSGGKMVESELGDVPMGWRVKELSKFINSIDNRGKTPPQTEGKTEYPIIDVKALSSNSRFIDYNNCTKFVSEETYNNWFRNGHPQPLDILISTVGSLAEMKLFFGDIGCVAQNVVGLRSVDISAFYLFQYLQFIKNDLVAYNIGSVQPSIKVTHIIKHKILIPNGNLLLEFHSIAQLLSNEIHDNCIQIQVLKEIRDSLLPKLMSGEIRVPNSPSVNCGRVTAVKQQRIRAAAVPL
jgi:type I restriction enzyme S subunit